MSSGARQRCHSSDSFFVDEKEKLRARIVELEKQLGEEHDHVAVLEQEIQGYKVQLSEDPEFSVDLIVLSGQPQRAHKLCHDTKITELYERAGKALEIDSPMENLNLITNGVPLNVTFQEEEGVIRKVERDLSSAGVGRPKLTYVRRFVPRSLFPCSQDGFQGTAMEIDRLSWIQGFNQELGMSFTMAARIKVKGPDNGQGGRILAKRQNTDGWEFVAPRYNGLVSFYVNGQHFDVGTTKVDDGKLHHVAVVYDHDAEEMAAYVDGMLDGKVRIPNELTEQRHLEIPIYMGARGGDQDVFKGKFDNVMVWQRKLDEAQIETLANDLLCMPTDHLDDCRDRAQT